MIALYVILLPVIGGIFSYLVGKGSKVSFFLIQITLLVLSVLLFRDVNDGTIVHYVIGGHVKGVGIELLVDNFSSIFILLTVVLFSVIFVYDHHEDYANRMFLFLLLVLEGVIIGIFASNDIFTIFVLIEVSTIIVSILIMFKKDSRSIYDGMLYLLINIVGMCFFSIGIGYLYKIYGTLNITVLKELMLSSGTVNLKLPFAFIITGVGLKSAIMPLFSWLPKAHGTPSAPPSVSAILSGIYIKCGVYLFLMFLTIFKIQINLQLFFEVTGFLTAVIGFVFALSQKDIKLILAYHTVSQVGLIVFGYSFGTTYALAGSIYHITVHALFKSSLFLSAGIIAEKYKTRNISEIRGLFSSMPFVSVMIVIAMLSITGAPFFSGSISKALISKDINTSFREVMFIIINLGTILSFVKYSAMLFGSSDKKFKVAPNQLIALAVLSISCIVMGVFGTQIVSYLFEINLKISFLDYLYKILIYIMNIGIGYVFYIYVYERIPLFTLIRNTDVSFNNIVFFITLFFATLLVI
jgi:multicomponent Na+:H+ antiporter subunit D